MESTLSLGSSLSPFAARELTLCLFGQMELELQFGLDPDPRSSGCRLLNCSLVGRGFCNQFSGLWLPAFCTVRLAWQDAQTGFLTTVAFVSLFIHSFIHSPTFGAGTGGAALPCKRFATLPTCASSASVFFSRDSLQMRFCCHGLRGTILGQL